MKRQEKVMLLVDHVISKSRDTLVEYSSHLVKHTASHFEIKRKTGRERVERVAHGIIFMVQKHGGFILDPPPTSHKLRQYCLVTHIDR